jgi:hypothetical protein
MALSELFFLAIVFYLLYRFIFNFLVPVARTTRQVREQFRNMQEQQPFHQEQPREHAQPQRPAQKPADKGDYLDFEEVKD